MKDMQNPIKDNRIVVDITFATRLLNFAKSVKVNDPSGEDEKESFVSYAEKLLEYQCLTAGSKEEIDYLKRVNVYDNMTKPFITTADGFDIRRSEEDCKIYSCLEKPYVGDQILEFTLKRFLLGRAEIKTNRLYFKDKDACKNYVEMNVPCYSKKEMQELTEKYNSAILK